MFAFAGIWRSFKGPIKKEGERVEIDTYAFLTTKPNELVATVHPSRMPVMLVGREAQETWLEGSAEDARKVIKTYNDTGMEIVQQVKEKFDLVG